MREAKKIRLRHAYLGPLTADQIARANAISKSVLHRFWAEEKAAGALPKVRPHYVEKTTLPPEAPALVVAVPAPEDAAKPARAEADDEAPLASPAPSYDRQCAALLDAMRLHHPELDNVREQSASPHWLRQMIEIIAWRVGVDEINRLLPSRIKLVAMCRARDMRVRA